MILFNFEQGPSGELQSKDRIWIDNKNKVFRGSDYEEGGFKVCVRPVDRNELRKYRRDAETRNGINNDLLLERIYDSHVIDWELNDINGNRINFTEGNKKFLKQKMPTFTNLIALAALDAQAIISEIKEDEIKNSLNSGSGD